MNSADWARMPGARKSRYGSAAGRDRVQPVERLAEDDEPQGRLDRARVELGAVVAQALDLDEAERADARGERAHDAQRRPSAVSRGGWRCGGCCGHPAGLSLRRRTGRRRGGGRRRRASRRGRSRRFSSAGVPTARSGPRCMSATRSHRPLGLVHVVGREQHGHPVCSRSSAMRSHTRPARDRVEADRRLVEDQQPRAVHERLGELQPADHAAGVRRDHAGRRARACRSPRARGRRAPARSARGHVEEPREQHRRSRGR